MHMFIYMIHMYICIYIYIYIYIYIHMAFTARCLIGGSLASRPHSFCWIEVRWLSSWDIHIYIYIYTIL